MEKAERKNKNWRIVKTPTRTISEVQTFLKGLQTNLDSELIDLACVSDVDGFIIYSGLWKKDWSLVYSSSEVFDNIRTVTPTQTVECSV